MKKGEFLVKTGTYRDIIIQDIKKSLDSRKDFNEEMDRFKDTKSFKQKEDKVNKINNLAEKTLVQPKDAKAKRSFTEGSASSGKAKNKVAYKDSSIVKEKKSKVMPYTWKSENKMRKAITAGMGGGTPDSKTGGAALGVESIEPTLHKPFKAAGESILKEWEENTPKKDKKKVKKSQPNMGFKQMGIENKPEMQVKTIDPNKEYTRPDGSKITQQEIEQKKIANKYTQGQKQQVGAKNIGEFDQDSINYINERKQQVAAGVDSEETHGVNIYDKEGKVNEAYDYSPSQSKEQMKETKGRGNYPSTKHHEGLHRTFSDLSQRTSEDHSKNLINYMLDNFFDKNTVKGVSDYVSTRYDKDDPHLQEEKLTHILDLITNPEKREDHNEKFVGGKVGDIDYKNLKAGWQKATKFAKKLDRKTLNEINDLYTNKSKNRQVKVEKIPPGGRK
jgi:hypothetical protein